VTKEFFLLTDISFSAGFEQEIGTNCSHGTRQVDLVGNPHLVFRRSHTPDWYAPPRGKSKQRDRLVLSFDRAKGRKKTIHHKSPTASSRQSNAAEFPSTADFDDPRQMAVNTTADFGRWADPYLVIFEQTPC